MVLLRGCLGLVSEILPRPATVVVDGTTSTNLRLPHRPQTAERSTREALRSTNEIARAHRKRGHTIPSQTVSAQLSLHGPKKHQQSLAGVKTLDVGQCWPR